MIATKLFGKMKYLMTLMLKCYLYFVHHVMYLLILENTNILCSRLHEIMMNFKNDLEIRINDKFFGAKFKKRFKYFNFSNQKNPERNFLTEYK